MLQIFVRIGRLRFMRRFQALTKFVGRRVEALRVDQLADVDSLVVIAHPDDDVLFFYDHIKLHKPLVVCMTNGGNLARRLEFRWATKALGVKGVIHNFRDVFDVPFPERELERTIAYYLSLKTWRTVATHNAEGEYGHIHHQQISECVRKSVDLSATALLMPPPLKDLEQPEFYVQRVDEKIGFLQKFYKTQADGILNSGRLYRRWVEYEGVVPYVEEHAHRP